MGFSLGVSGKTKKSESGVEKQTSVDQTQIDTSKAITDQTQKTQQTATTDVATTQKQTQKQTGSTTGTQTGVGTTTQVQDQATTALTSLLGEETLLDLQTLVGDLLPRLGREESDVGNILDLITERAQSAKDVITGENIEILDLARSQGEEKLKGLQTQLAQQAGGSLANLGVVGATAQGAADLETQLASLSSKLNLQARETETGELLKALEGAQGQEGQVVALLNILKGATQEQAGTATGTATGTTDTTQTTAGTTVSDVVSDITGTSKTTAETTSISDLFSTATTEQQSQLTKLINDITRTTTKEKSGKAGIGFT